MGVFFIGKKVNRVVQGGNLEFWAREWGRVYLEGESVFWNRSFNKRAKRVVRCAALYIMLYTMLYITLYTKLCIILYTTLYTILSIM